MLYLKPSEILYSQESIKNIFTGRHFHSGRFIGETLDELADGRTTVERIDRISVIEIDGRWTTADNRRLWVFKNFELLGGCTCIPAIQTKRINPMKLNSRNGGTGIRVKGHPGGKWYDKLITSPAQYQNCLRGLFVDPYNRASSASKIDVCIRNPPNHPETDNNEEFLNIRQDIDSIHAFSSQPKSVVGYHEQSELNRTASNTVHTLYERSTSTPYTPQIGVQRSSHAVENENETSHDVSLEQSFRTMGLNSTVSSLHSTNMSNDMSLRNCSRQAEGFVPCTTQASSDRLAYGYENKTGTNINLYPAFSLNKRVQCEERNKYADLHRPINTDVSPLPGTRIDSFEGPAQKAGTKLKRASIQAFMHFKNIKQMKATPKPPSVIMLDPSKIRYTQDAIECPLRDTRWPTVHRRLLDLLETENQKPLEAYLVYNMYWIKKENDVLWFLKEHPEWRKTKINLKVLVIEDNDAFLDFMRKEKPWLQISDILQCGQSIELVK
ncbi:hypothetical protein CHS0354_028500 [Potamilus streckersoni]|uniref:Uncharacterized protein n=1 Tax=Potamilus streckersoni TaxID=2493646 RepID=A0AAE0SEE2_9BIVA|nr:hypothetical protein CHS0354_028500 [Potamilus streckersoni]